MTLAADHDAQDDVQLQQRQLLQPRPVRKDPQQPLNLPAVEDACVSSSQLQQLLLAHLQRPLLPHPVAVDRLHLHQVASRTAI